MDEREKLRDNLRKGRIYAAFGNIIGAIFFIITYMYMKKTLILIAALILLFAGIAIFLFFSKIENIIFKNDNIQGKE
jgi:VIT1/CCC1 family predicted Fe2+/Mn2+ transporter